MIFFICGSKKELHLFNKKKLYHSQQHNIIKISINESLKLPIHIIQQTKTTNNRIK